MDDASIAPPPVPLKASDKGIHRCLHDPEAGVGVVGGALLVTRTSEGPFSIVSKPIHIHVIAAFSRCTRLTRLQM